MKLFFNIFLLAFALKTNALGFNIINVSFNDSTPISFSSDQYVDLTCSGSYTSGDSIKIWIWHDNPTTADSDGEILFRRKFYTYFLGLPVQSDGSRRVYFTMPSDYPETEFFISINLGVDHANGLFDVATTVPEYNDINNNNSHVIKINYYNLNGQLTNYSEGLLIKETFFANGVVRREKVFKRFLN